MRSADKLSGAAKRLHEADRRIDRAVSLEDADEPVDSLLEASEVGDQGPLRILSSAVVLAGLIAGDRRLTRAGVRMLLAHETTTLAKNFLKDSIDRTRPRSAERPRDRALKPGDDRSKEVSSFPSGHSAGAIAVARAFSREYSGLAPIALGSAAVIALAQVPRRSHYFSDVAAGLLIGAAMEALTNLYWRAGGDDQAGISAPR